MQSIVTDREAWSVGRSVTLVSPAKTAEPIEMPFGWLRWAQGTIYYMVVQIPHGKGQLWEGKGHTIIKY